MPEISGHMMTANGPMTGVLRFGDTIESLSDSQGVDDRIILPGIIDCHIHGGGGGDVMDGISGELNISRTAMQFQTRIWILAPNIRV